MVKGLCLLLFSFAVLVVKLTIGLVFVAGGLGRGVQGGCGLYKVIMVFTLEGLQSR